MDASALLDISPVMPIVVLDDAAQAVPLAQTLLNAGIRIIELTLRTPAALDGIKRIAAEVPELTIGAGTIISSQHVESAVQAGAQFLVTPGATDSVVSAALASGLPFLPGAATASEVMRLAEQGVTAVKFFPAEAAGGVAYLKALYGPLPDVTFCPTGGISLEKAPKYLALPSVRCVGGSWLTPRAALAADDFATIEALARKAVRLSGADKTIGDN